MEEIIFVTGNKGKQASAQKYLSENDVKVECYNYEYDEPNINDIELIAISKVKQAYNKVNKPCIALDCGFYIPEYPNNPNFPGAFPKRELLDKIGINGLLQNMKNVNNRYCYFKEVLAYFDGSEIKLFYGISEGTLSDEIKGLDRDKKWSDLWYVFIPKNCDKTFAQMTELERETRNDGHTSGLQVFSEWYNSKTLTKHI